MTEQPGLDLVGPRVTLTPLRYEHAERLRVIRKAEQVRCWWADLDSDNPDWPLEADAPVRFSVLSGGEVIGMIQYSEEPDPRYRHAGVDIFLAPDAQGRGLGREAVRLLSAHLFAEHGHHRLVIDPAVDNVAAIGCYTSVGFRPVGLMRAYERDVDGPGWHDAVLMELLAEDFKRSVRAFQGQV